MSIGYPSHDKCGGLLMMPYEAGMPIPVGVDGVAFCTSCSPKRGLVAPSPSVFARARAASAAAGAREYVGELRASYVGKGARVALERALCGDGKSAKRKRNGFALCRSFQLVNDDGTATEAGRAFARRIGIAAPIASSCAPAATEPAPVIVAEPAPAAPTVETRSPWRWVGGKGALLPDIMAAMPEKFGRLLVPFVGGGALVFAMPGRVAYISDANTHLMNAYVAIRDRVEDLILALQDHKNDRDYYDAVVESFNDGYGDDVWRAGAFIYMNKVCFNGLCRYSRRTGFNVPFGDNPSATICDADNLRACSAALQKIEIAAEDFRAVEERTQPGDLVYLDPPYVPESKTSAFTGYWGKWGDEEHEAVAAIFRRLAARGVHVLASNSDTPKARELYSGFEIRTLTRANSVNSKASARGGKAEILVLGGTWTPRGAS